MVCAEVNKHGRGASIQITKTDANLVLINVKAILPTLLSVDLYPKVTGLRVPSVI